MKIFGRSTQIQSGSSRVPPILADAWPGFCAFARVRRLVCARWLKRAVAIRLRVEDETGQTVDWVLKRHADEASAQAFHDFAARIERHFEQIEDILVSRPQAVIKNWVVEPYIDCRSIRWALLHLGPDARLLEDLGSRYATYLWHIHSLDSNGNPQQLRTSYEAIAHTYDQFILDGERIADRCRAYVLNRLERLGNQRTWRALRHNDFQVNNLCYTTGGKAVIFDPAVQLHGLNVKDLGELIVSLDNMPPRYPFVSAGRIARFRRAFLDAYASMSGVSYPVELWELIAMLYSCKRFCISRKALADMHGLQPRTRLRHLVACHRQRHLITRYLKSEQ